MKKPNTRPRFEAVRMLSGEQLAVIRGASIQNPKVIIDGSSSEDREKTGAL